VAPLAWDGLINVRDLGGLPTEDGGETRIGAIVRADSVRRLSAEGWEALVGFGIHTIIDLRHDEELATDPPVELPVEVVHVPLLPGFDAPDWVEINELVYEAADPASAQAASYLAFLERFGLQFATAIRAVAEAPPGGVLVHCLAGKDRTGLIAALLLRLADVPVGAIADDYALSEANVRAVLQRWIEEAEDERERVLRTRISATPRETMVDVLGELERRHGSVREYLLAVGADEATLGRARARLRG
jgi:protein-tyrosine phosphatase